jgi:cytochrome P450
LYDLAQGLLGNGGGRIDMRSGLERQFRQLGPVVRQLGGPLKFVNLFGPDANRFVLMDRGENFSARRPWMQIMGRIFPDGLLLRDGGDHKHHRMIMHQAFKRPALRNYAERMNPKIAAGIASWGREPRRLLAFPALKELTLELAAEIFLGVDLGPRTQRMNGAFENMVAASMSRLRLRIPGLEFHRGLKGREYMLGFLQNLIEQKRVDASDDMFSRLSRAQSEAGDRLQDREVIDHMVFLMMAAHDTTTSTLTSLCYELARHPQWQQRIRDESIALGNPSPGFDDLAGLTSLTLAMHETLRMYPPLPVIPRASVRAFDFEGYRIPEGAMCVVAPIHTHRMPEWWSHPDRFDPERFSSSRAEHERHTHSYIPFGGGAHMCIGRRFAEAQVRLVIHHLVQRHRWRVPDGYEMPVQQAPISKPRDGLPLEIEPIH